MGQWYDCSILPLFDGPIIILISKEERNGGNPNYQLGWTNLTESNFHFMYE
jgi:hypothetical protein